MSPIGGFLPLEIARCGEPHHTGAAALSSGRACWHLILRTCRPPRVRLPFYICDAMLQPLAATRTPFDFYHIDAELPADPRLAAVGRRTAGRGELFRRASIAG